MFIVDTEPFSDSDDVSKEEAALMKDFKKRSLMLKSIKKKAIFGDSTKVVLSIPDVREDVFRHDTITIEYMDEDFNKRRKYMMV